MRLFTLAASTKLITGYATDNYEGQGSPDSPTLLLDQVDSRYFSTKQ